MDEQLYRAVPRMLEDGFKLLPLEHKKPRIADWGQKASDDLATIEQWLRWPNTTGLGVATGPSRLLVVDIDGPEGQRSLQKWQDEHGDLPETRMQSTGRADGRHLLFRVDEPACSRANFLPKVDIRGIGGQIVIAPSWHPLGLRYTTNDAPIVQAPDALLDAVGRYEGVALTSKVSKALEARRGYRSDQLFVIYRWAVDNNLKGQRLFDLILASPIGTKAREHPDPIDWLCHDFERFHDKRQDDYDPLSNIQHVLATWSNCGLKLNSSDQKIVDALGGLALSRRSIKVTRSFTDLGVDAGIDPKTVKRRTGKLARLGFFEAAKGGPMDATVWKLTTPMNCMETSIVCTGEEDAVKSVPPSPLPALVLLGGTDLVLDPSLDEYRYQILGGSYGYLRQLSTGEKSIEDLMESLAVGRRSVRYHLSKLTGLELCEEPSSGRFALTPDHKDVLRKLAGDRGVEGRKVREQARNEQNKTLRRTELERGRDKRREAEDLAGRMRRPSVADKTFQELSKLRGAVVQNGHMIDLVSGEVLAQRDDDNWHKWPETNLISAGLAATTLAAASADAEHWTPNAG